MNAKTKAMDRTEKYYQFLEMLHYHLEKTSELSMTRVRELHRLPPQVSTAAQELGIIEKENDGRHAQWYWKAGSPSMDMAEELMNMTEPIKKRPREKPSGMAGRINKYLEFLRDVKKNIEEKDGNIASKKFAQHHNVDVYVFKYLTELGVVEKEGVTSLTKWKWIGPEPNTQMVRDLIERSRQGNRERKEVSENKKEQVKVSYVHLLWGLIKIKVTHHDRD